MPTKSSTTGWKTERPNFGAISTTKIAEPMANGMAMIVDSSVTANEPTIMGSAPTVGMPLASSTCGFHSVPVKNAMGLMPFTKNVARPCWATMKIRVMTSSTTMAMQAADTDLPARSTRPFLLSLRRPPLAGVSCAVDTDEPSSSFQYMNRPPGLPQGAGRERD